MYRLKVWGSFKGIYKGSFTGIFWALGLKTDLQFKLPGLGFTWTLRNLDF